MHQFLLMPLSEEQRKNLKERFIQGVKNAFNGDPGNTIYGQPVEDFIAGPAPSGPLGRFQWESGRRICRRWAAGRTPNILPGRDIYYRQLCEPYIEDAFGPLGDGSAGPPFTGGQCTFQYAVGTGGTATCPNSFGDFAQFTSGPGPIAGITSVTIDTGGFPVRWRTTWTVQFSDGPRTFTVGHVDQPAPCVRVFPATPGQPDNCGNLPDDWSPGTGPTIPPETGPIPSPPGWPIPDFDIDITVDPDGTINIDFGDGEPPEPIAPEPTEPGGDGLPPGDQGEPGSGGEAAPGDDAEGEAPEGQVLVGLRLQLIDPGPNPKIFAGGVYRGAAYIYMGGDVSLDQDFAGSLLIDDQFIYAEKDNLTRWRVASNSGFRWNVTPYYRDFSS